MCTTDSGRGEYFHNFKDIDFWFFAKNQKSISKIGEVLPPPTPGAPYRQLLEVSADIKTISVRPEIRSGRPFKVYAHYLFLSTVQFWRQNSPRKQCSTDFYHNTRIKDNCQRFLCIKNDFCVNSIMVRTNYNYQDKGLQLTLLYTIHRQIYVI